MISIKKWPCQSFYIGSTSCLSLSSAPREDWERVRGVTYVKIVAIDLPGGERIRDKNIKAQFRTRKPILDIFEDKIKKNTDVSLQRATFCYFFMFVTLKMLRVATKRQFSILKNVYYWFACSQLGLYILIPFTYVNL